MNEKHAIYAFALCIGLCIAAISYFSALFPYGVDSAGYIEQARSFLARGRFEVLPYNKWGGEITPTPSKLFPPGYPLLVILASIVVHGSVELAAPLLSLASLFVLPVVVVFSFHKILGLWPSFWIALLVAFTPSIVKYGYVAYSDLPSLIWVIFTVNRLLVAELKIAPWFVLGLLGGFAYLIRNANLGLLITIGVYITWRFILEVENRRAWISSGLSWLAGTGIVLAPWLLRNYLVFGTFQPYSMPPSTVGLVENIHDFVISQLDTLTAQHELNQFLSEHVAGVFLLLFFGMGFVWAVFRSWPVWSDIEQKTFVVCAFYSLIGAAITIVARTKFQWGVHILPRYAIPYSCFLFVAFWLVLKNESLTKRLPHWLPMAILVLFLFRLFELPTLYQSSGHQKNLRRIERSIESDPATACDLSMGRVLVSNEAYVYRILCRINGFGSEN